MGQTICTGKRVLLLLASALLGACASAPPLDGTGARLELKPYQIDAETGMDEATVLWGGMIVEVVNRERSTEMTVLAYPLDPRQRPQVQGPSEGRFIAVLPGFVEPLDYPQGRFVSLRGRMFGSREGSIDARSYRYPLVQVQAAHLWPRDFRNDGPRLSIGIGVGIAR
jgi:outer membrane lipoprotein